LSSIAEGEAWTFGDVAPRKALPRSLVIGVDIDGVLGDQIAGIIPRVASDHSVHLTFDMIDDYRFTLGRVSIADEIAKAQASRDYVEKMPTFPGARQMLEALRQDHRVIIVTARAPETRDATRVWLARERLVHDGLVFTAEAGKSAHGLDGEPRRLSDQHDWPRDPRQTALESQGRGAPALRSLSPRARRDSAGRDPRHGSNCIPEAARLSGDGPSGPTVDASDP